MGNKSFFQRAKTNTMTFGDIFADVFKKHTPEDTGRMFIAGTPLTTPAEADMLANWTKPFAFARFFGLGVVVMLLLYITGAKLGSADSIHALLSLLPLLMPVTFLLLIWEMHIPRDISLYEVLLMVMVGGALSIACTLLILTVFGSAGAMWAGLVEEPAKLIAIYLFLRRKKGKSYILNGMLIGFAVGTGFSFMESIGYTYRNYTVDVVYFVLSNLENGSDLASLVGHAPFFSLMLSDEYSTALNVALLRSFNTLGGSHGLYASLYGGALAWVKGKEELKCNHLFDVKFLKYFALAVLLHALNNLGVDFGLPRFFYGIIGVQTIIVIAIKLACWFPLLKAGVNEIVTISLEANGGLTNAIKGHQADAAGPVVKAASVGSDPVWYLIGMAGDCAGREIRMEKGNVVKVGRDRNLASLAVPGCPSVSSLHCEFFYDGTTMYVKDLGSTNGTFIQGKKQPQQTNIPLNDGTVVFLADKNCSFKAVRG